MEETKNAGYIAPKKTAVIEEAAGKEVVHSTFGSGKIVEAYSMTNGLSYAEVEFGDGSKRLFAYPLDQKWFAQEDPSAPKFDENGELVAPAEEAKPTEAEPEKVAQA